MIPPLYSLWPLEPAPSRSDAVLGAAVRRTLVTCVEREPDPAAEPRSFLEDLIRELDR